MKVTELWVYPIKAIRGIRLDTAKIGPQGIQHDRCFMLCRVEESGELSKMQLSKYPECSIFAQKIVGRSIHVEYVAPHDAPISPHLGQTAVLEVPLEPDIRTLHKADINLHQSLVVAYRMDHEYDDWFSARFGFDVALIFIGDGRRPVLGTFSPKSQRANSSWLSLMASYVTGSQPDEEDWLTFTDCAPFLVATEKSLENVSARMDEARVEMGAFRPNLVVDGEIEWDEDFWGEISINGNHRLTLTKNCNRCTSLNVDYDTGRTAKGERGTVLKKLMSDRRVDAGSKYTPVFGRYGFLTKSADGSESVSVGDQVEVSGRLTKRAVWDWPLKDPRVARYYQAV